jgi:T5SS/PEP-CTERM-associated repeat protein
MALGMGGAGELIMTNGGFVESDFVSVGAQLGGSGRVSVLGSTINGPTTWKPLAAFVGDKSFGELQVTNGALAVIEVYLTLGADQYGIGAVRVSGVDAQNRASHLSTSALRVGGKGQANFSIGNGGSADATSVEVGAEATGSGTLVVDGVHSASGKWSELAADSLTVGSGFNAQGPTGKGTVEIRNGAFVGVDVCYLLCAQAGRRSEVTVTGAGSELIVTNLMIVGYPMGNQGDSVLTLNNGYVEAAYVDVSHNGTIRGVGTLQTTVRLVNDNGTIAPGLSPGVLTIQGGYEQGPNGRLLIEIGGTNAFDHDQLIVTSNVTLNGDVVLHFLDGFAPKTGDSFPFLDVGGTAAGEFSAVGLENLAPGFQFQFVTNGAQLGITALNDGVFSAALPGEVQVVVTNIGGFTYASYTITTSNTCERIKLSGPLTQTSNVFSQAFQGTTFVKPDCIVEIATTNGAILLGQLSPGEYSFRVMANTQVVETVAFTITSEATQTLSSPVRLADGSLQFEINGLAPIGFTVEASADLETWIPLEQGVLPFTYVDPDAAIFPQRFYRAIIAP